MSIKNLSFQDSISDFANNVIEYGKFFGSKVCEWSNDIYVYGKDTAVPKIIEIWNNTIVPAAKETWSFAKPQLEKAVEWIKSPTGTAACLTGVGVSTFIAGNELKGPKAFVVKTAGAVCSLVGFLKLLELKGL